MSSENIQALHARLRKLARQFPENSMKLMLENPKNTRDLLALTGSRVVDSIDFDRLKLMPTTFVARDYRHVESDMVMVAPLRGVRGTHPAQKRITLYILIEHQSEKDPIMAFRVLDYVVQLYRSQILRWSDRHRSHAGLHLQSVLPVVFYTGTRPWQGIGTLQDLVLGGDRFQAEIPVMNPLLVNLPAFDPEKLEQEGGYFGRVFRLVQARKSRRNAFGRLLVRILGHLETMPPEDRLRWLEHLTYIQALIYHMREPSERAKLQAMIETAVRTDEVRQEMVAMGRTIADELKDEGRVEATRTSLLRLIRQRFGELPRETVDRIETTDDLDQLNAWLDRFVAAETLEDMGIVA